VLFEVGQPEELHSSALVLLVMKVPYQEESPAERPQRCHSGDSAVHEVDSFRALFVFGLPGEL
jgi:hypothetical protein